MISKIVPYSLVLLMGLLIGMMASVLYVDAQTRPSTIGLLAPLSKAYVGDEPVLAANLVGGIDGASMLPTNLMTINDRISNNASNITAVENTASTSRISLANAEGEIADNKLQIASNRQNIADDRQTIAAIEADDWVIGRRIAAETIGGGNIVSNFLEDRHVPTELIDDRMMGANSVGNSEMKSNAIGLDEMQDNAVGLAEMTELARAAISAGVNAEPVFISATPAIWDSTNNNARIHAIGIHGLATTAYPNVDDIRMLVQGSPVDTESWNAATGARVVFADIAATSARNINSNLRGATTVRVQLTLRDGGTFVDQFEVTMPVQ